MNEHKHTIYGIVGPSGSGKTTLILEIIKRFPHIKIIKSTSTRPKRDDLDGLFYDLIPETEFQNKIDSNQLINYHKYSDYWYGTNSASTRQVLENNCGIFALVENSVADIRSAGIKLKLIKIIPEKKGQLIRSAFRSAADQVRAQIPLDYELTVLNSFAPGGLDKALSELSGYFQKELAYLPQNISNLN